MNRFTTFATGLLAMSMAAWAPQQDSTLATPQQASDSTNVALKNLQQTAAPTQETPKAPEYFAYYNDFDAISNDNDIRFLAPAGNNYQTSSTQNGLWLVDSNPQAMSVRDDRSRNTLNYNSSSGNYNVDQDANGPEEGNWGIALTGAIDLGKLKRPVLTFACNYETETDGEGDDRRYVVFGRTVKGADGKETFKYLMYDFGGTGTDVKYVLSGSETSSTAVIQPCAAMKTWHIHSVPLDARWGEIRVGFGFRARNNKNNDKAGWFVDDVGVFDILHPKYIEELNSYMNQQGLSQAGAGEKEVAGPTREEAALNEEELAATETPAEKPVARKSRTSKTAKAEEGREDSKIGQEDEALPPVAVAADPKIDPVVAPVVVEEKKEDAAAKTDETTKDEKKDGEQPHPQVMQAIPFAVPYHTTFDMPESVKDWKRESLQGGVEWNFDGTPGAIGEEKAYVTAPASLNYNNGTNFESGNINMGQVTSPMIDLRDAKNPVLTFYCAYDTEIDVQGQDLRVIHISNDPQFLKVQYEGLFATGAKRLELSCPETKKWHQHSVKLDPSWGIVQVRFLFNSANAANNQGAGWFIDEFDVREGGAPVTKSETPATKTEVKSGETKTSAAASSPAPEKKKKKRGICSASAAQSDFGGAAMVIIVLLGAALAVRRGLHNRVGA